MGFTTLRDYSSVPIYSFSCVDSYFLLSNSQSSFFSLANNVVFLYERMFCFLFFDVLVRAKSQGYGVAVL